MCASRIPSIGASSSRKTGTGPKVTAISAANGANTTVSVSACTSR